MRINMPKLLIVVNLGILICVMLTICSSPDNTTCGRKATQEHDVLQSLVADSCTNPQPATVRIAELFDGAIKELEEAIRKWTAEMPEPKPGQSIEERRREFEAWNRVLKKLCEALQAVKKASKALNKEGWEVIELELRIEAQPGGLLTKAMGDRKFKVKVRTTLGELLAASRIPASQPASYDASWLSSRLAIAFLKQHVRDAPEKHENESVEEFVGRARQWREIVLALMEACDEERVNGQRLFGDAIKELEETLREWTAEMPERMPDQTREEYERELEAYWRALKSQIEAVEWPSEWIFPRKIEDAGELGGNDEEPEK